MRFLGHNILHFFSRRKRKNTKFRMVIRSPRHNSITSHRLRFTLYKGKRFFSWVCVSMNKRCEVEMNSGKILSLPNGSRSHDPPGAGGYSTTEPWGTCCERGHKAMCPARTARLKYVNSEVRNECGVSHNESLIAQWQSIQPTPGMSWVWLPFAEGSELFLKLFGLQNAFSFWQRQSDR